MSLSAISFSRSMGRGQKTATAGTKIISICPPVGGLGGDPGDKNLKLKTKIGLIKYTAGTTAHTGTVLRPLHVGTVPTVTAAALASATTFTVSRDPGNYSANAIADGRPFVPSNANRLIAANDFYLVHLPDGTWWQDTVSSVTTGTVSTAAPQGFPYATAPITVTPTGTIPTGGFAAGAAFYWFGVETSTDPNNPVNAEAHPQFTLTASTAVTLGDNSGELIGAFRPGDPLLFISNNATAAGTLNYLQIFYGI